MANPDEPTPEQQAIAEAWSRALIQSTRRIEALEQRSVLQQTLIDSHEARLAKVEAMLTGSGAAN